MVVSLKHVDIPVWDKERLNISVKTLASWSAHALMNTLWYSGLVIVNLFKHFTHIGYGERDLSHLGKQGLSRKAWSSFGSSASLGNSWLFP
jgi:hypothetical protein